MAEAAVTLHKNKKIAILAPNPNPKPNPNFHSSSNPNVNSCPNSKSNPNPNDHLKNRVNEHSLFALLLSLSALLQVTQTTSFFLAQYFHISNLNV